MPTISVTRDILYERLGKTFTDEDFEDECFDFGIELDDIVEENNVVKFKIDIPANRYDLLCVEGLSRAMNVFRDRMVVPKFTVVPGKEKVIVKDSVSGVRPYCVAAVLRDMKFTEESYNSFILLQDKLHQNIGRERSLVSIGTHDLDTIQGPFTYQALAPEQIKFQPLNQDTEMTEYIRYIDFEGKPLYPLITDANGVVLSLPPIINGEHSKITLNTKNVFIEVTACDRAKCRIVIDTICAMFSEYCSSPFTCESVTVESGSGSIQTPPMKYQSMECSAAQLCTKGGITGLTPDSVADHLTKMFLPSKAVGEQVTVEIGPTRHDILHQCDVEEDLAIAYGYNNITEQVPNLHTIGAEQEVNKLSDAIREELARAGFTEVLTFSLCSMDDISTSLRNGKALEDAVQIANPKSNEFQVVRTSLLPGILKTASCNRKMPLPLKLFEVSDVVFKTEDTETGSKNQRKICALFSGKTSGFEVVHGLLDRIMLSLSEKNYSIRASEESMFFTGRGADILLGTEKIGHLGILHPEVLENFEISLPCSVLEMSLEPFV